MNQNDIELLSNESIPESVRTAYVQSKLKSEDAVLEYDINLRRLTLERRKLFWNTPLVAALAGLITLGATYLFSNLSSQHAARIDATARERQFQYQLMKSELAKKKTYKERAEVLLFLTEAGVLTTLDSEKLRKMATRQIENPDEEIIPQLENVEDGNRIVFRDRVPPGSAVHFWIEPQGESSADTYEASLTLKGAEGAILDNVDISATSESDPFVVETLDPNKRYTAHIAVRFRRSGEATINHKIVDKNGRVYGRLYPFLVSTQEEESIGRQTIGIRTKE